jgi:hypothetical protein
MVQGWKGQHTKFKQRSPEQYNSDGYKEHVASIFRVKEYAKQQPSVKAGGRLAYDFCCKIIYVLRKHSSGSNFSSVLFNNLYKLSTCSFVHQCNTFTSYFLLIVDMFRPHKLGCLQPVVCTRSGSDFRLT